MRSGISEYPTKVSICKMAIHNPRQLVSGFPGDPIIIIIILYSHLQCDARESVSKWESVITKRRPESLVHSNKITWGGGGG